MAALAEGNDGENQAAERRGAEDLPGDVEAAALRVR